MLRKRNASQKIFIFLLLSLSCIVCSFYTPTSYANAKNNPKSTINSAQHLLFGNLVDSSNIIATGIGSGIIGGSLVMMSSTGLSQGATTIEEHTLKKESSSKNRTLFDEANTEIPAETPEATASDNSEQKPYRFTKRKKFAPIGLPPGELNLIRDEKGEGTKIQYGDPYQKSKVENTRNVRFRGIKDKLLPERLNLIGREPVEEDLREKQRSLTERETTVKIGDTYIKLRPSGGLNLQRAEETTRVEEEIKSKRRYSIFKEKRNMKVPMSAVELNLQQTGNDSQENLEKEDNSQEFQLARGSGTSTGKEMVKDTKKIKFNGKIIEMSTGEFSLQRVTGEIQKQEVGNNSPLFQRKNALFLIAGISLLILGQAVVKIIMERRALLVTALPTIPTISTSKRKRFLELVRRLLFWGSSRR